MDRQEYQNNYNKLNCVKLRKQNLVKSKQRYEKRRLLIQQLKNKPCNDCGKTYHPACMDFDHVRGEKIKGISRMYSCKLEDLMKEIEKCDLVCANCHRLRTFYKYTRNSEIL